MQLLQFLFEDNWHQSNSQQHNPRLFDNQQMLKSCVLISNFKYIFADGTHCFCENDEVHHEQAERVHG